MMEDGQRKNVRIKDFCGCYLLLNQLYGSEGQAFMFHCGLFQVSEKKGEREELYRLV